MEKTDYLMEKTQTTLKNLLSMITGDACDADMYGLFEPLNSGKYVFSSIDAVYFILEISRVMEIEIADDFLEKCMYWSIHDYAVAILLAKNQKENQ